MSTHWNPVRIAAFAAFGLLLSGCAQFYCGSHPDKAQCFAAYAQWEDCKAGNSFLIRQVGTNVVTHCREEPRRCKDGRCRGGYETCSTRHEPIYDYTQFNYGVSQCMRVQGLSAYGSLFGPAR